MTLQENANRAKSALLPKDDYTTPRDLALECIKRVPLKAGQVVLDPFRGSGSFYDQYPGTVVREWEEIQQGRDFFAHQAKVDWIVSNPPYSCLDEVLEHSVKRCRIGFAYLILGIHLTPRRLERMASLGFPATKILVAEVDAWMGRSFFVQFDLIGEPCLDWISKTYQRSRRGSYIPRQEARLIPFANEAVAPVGNLEAKE